MQIHLLNQEMTLSLWPTIAPMLERARETGQGESAMVDYMRKILLNQTQCWAIVDEHNNIIGAGLTELLQYSQHKTLHIILFAGIDFEQQSKMFPSVIDYAKQQGCTAIEQWGRDGWAKVLPKRIPGFKKVYTVMRYDLGENNED